LQVLETLGPVVLALTPAAPFIPAVIAGIRLAESHGGTGAEKKALAQSTALAIANGVNAVTGQPTIPSGQLEAVTGQAIDTVVGVVNLTHKAAEAPTP
jgi:hypothetical protein